MIIETEDEAAAWLAERLAKASVVAAFTGAGLSTESGVPDYRSRNSPWTRLPPIPYDRFLAEPALRVEAWRRKFAMDDLYAGARPSRGHAALSRLVEAGRLEAIITQNIDNLHQASGVPADRLIELHGNGTYATCLACGLRGELEAIRAAFERSGTAPRCTACGGIVKSATISFGQSLPRAVLEAARDVTTRSDLFLAMGSSLVVYPAAAFPILARRNGAGLVIVNREATPLDTLADLVLRGDLGAILSKAVTVS